MNVIKEIKVTNSFLGMDKEKTECQNEEDPEDCKSRHNMNAFIQHCGCIPFGLRLAKNVSFSSFSISAVSTEF